MKRIRIFAFVVICLGIFQPSKAQKLDEAWLQALNQGKEAYAASRYAEALEHFSKASQIIPTDTTAYIYMIDCGVKLNKPQVVYQGIEKLEFAELHNVWMYSKGLQMARDVQKDLDRAFLYLGKMKEISPGSQYVQAEEIKTYYVNEDYKKSRELIGKYLEKYPGSYAQLTMLLRIAIEVDKNYPEALSLLAEAEKKYPDSLYLEEMEANVHLLQGETETARIKFEDIIRRDPKDAKAYYNLARIYFDADSGDRAIAYSEKAISLDSMFVNAIYNLGTYYYYYGLSYNQAISEMNIEQYIEQGKGIEDSAILFLTEAKPYFERVIRIKPDELDAYQNLNTINVLLQNLSNNVEATAGFLPKEKNEKHRVSKAVNFEMDLPSSEPMQKPELAIQDLQIKYPTSDTSGLHKGETGYIQFSLLNNGTARAGGLEAVIMEPVSIPDLEYNATLPSYQLNPGGKMEVSLPVRYLENNVKTTGIEKMSTPANKLRIYIRDSLGNVTGLDEVTLLLSKGLAHRSDYAETEDIVFNPITGGRNFLLVIAIDDYLNWPKLHNAVSDAEAVKDILLKKYRFVPDYLYELRNSDASKDKIRNALIKIKQEITDSDNLVIYYAGHGDYNTDLNEGVWIPYDARLDASQDYLPNSTLISYLRSLHSRHIFLVADACFSGSLFVSDAEVTYQEYNDKIKSRWALSSGNMEYVSDGAAGTSSPFASYLVGALKDNKRDRISVSELVTYVKLMVKNVSSQTPVGKPLRGLGNEGGDYIFYTK